MRKPILLLAVLFVAAMSPAQSYTYGQMMGWSVEIHSYHGATRKIAVYRIRSSMTTYTVTQGTTKPSELADQKLVEFRIEKDKSNKSVMYVKAKSDEEVMYSIVSITSMAR
jgi:hypothetical protein